MSSQKLGEK